MSFVAFPFQVDVLGRTGMRGALEHVRDLVEQLLFTAPGERVNRPTFGCGLSDLLFSPIDDAVSAATEALVRGALETWLGALIRVEAVTVRTEESRVSVDITYVVRATEERREDHFERTS